MGVLGVLCIWFDGNFRIAVAVAAFVFWFGAGLVHIEDIRKNNNHSGGNGWVHVVLSNFLVPVLTLILVFTTTL